MCGIAGSLTRDAQHSAAFLLARMQAVQKHRGPDHQGEWSEGQAALGNARLSIQDLSAAGNQPMITPDGRFVLVYNGEIYNHPQLREDLAKAGVSFRSSSDTETLLMGLAAQGEAFIEKLDGMFAFAFFDRRENKLLLARDRSGIKPLYYYHGSGLFLFASEIKSVAAALGNILKPDLAALRDVFSQGYSCGDLTPFEGVKSLSPGMKMEIAPGGTLKQGFFCDILDGIRKDYWEKRSAQSETMIEQELEAQIERSVKAHLISNAPVGVVCSGGVDSSLIAAFAAKTLPGIRLYHAAVPGELGEEAYARKVAERLGLELRVARLTRELFLKTWPRAIYHNDFPSYHANDVPFYLVSLLAREEGIKVLLSGEGADELFGGYLVNLELSRRRFFRNLFKKIPGKLQAFLTAASEAWIVKDGTESFWVRALEASGLESRGRIRAVLKSELLFQGNGQRLQKLIEIGERTAFLPESEGSKAGYLTERMYGHLGSLLLRNDRMGMMASIETRIPYLSNELLSSWLGMPLRFKIRGKGHAGLKYMIKNIASRHLPAEICRRPKMGFPIPLKSMLRPSAGIFKDGFIQEHLRIPFKVLEKIYQSPQDYYRGASVEMWGRIFFRNERPENLSGWLLEHC